MGPLTDLTIQVPSSATQHNNSHTLCIRGPPWKDALTVVTFFATNYVAHAATVKSSPGEGTISTAFMTLLALCFPMFGLLRAINAIARRARFGGSELRNACRAGALCMVVRGPDWRPDPGTELEAVLIEQIPPEQEMNTNMEEGNVPKVANMVNYFPSYAHEDSSTWAYFDTIGSRAYVDSDLTRIHGSYHLSPGYTFAIVPRNAKVDYIKNITPDDGRAAQKSMALEDSSSATNSGQLSLSGSQSAQDNPSVNARRTASAHSGHTNINVARSDAQSKEAPVASHPNEATDKKPLKSDISSNYSIVKAIASLIQLLAGLDTLILHREDVIGRWGYAAFHLTVIPYMLMTTVNFISNLLVADYACLYMVESDTMREAKARGCKFTGTVGSLQGYQLQNHAEYSAIEVAGWNGFTQRQMANLARFLSGELMDIEIILRRASRHNMRSTNTRFHRVDTTQPGNISLAQVEVNRATTQEARTLSLERDTHRDGNHRTSSQERVSPDSSHYNGDAAVQASTAAGTTPHDSDKADSTVSNQKSHMEAMIVLETSEGRRFRVKAHTPSKLINLPKWKSSLKPKKSLAGPSRPRKFDFSDLMHNYVDILVISLGTINPVYRRLIDVMEESRKQRTGDETWTTHLRLLFRGVYFPDRNPDKTKERKAKIYFPNCSPFVREGEDPSAPPKSRGNVGVMMTLQVLLGCVILAVLITFVGWQSHWFSRGHSSRTERAIIMLWMCEGAFGLLLPWVSLKEMIMIFLLLPFYATISYAPSSKPYQALLTFERISILAFVPIGIFIAPVWAFVLIGRMLVEWGRCTRLY